ncbi:DUF4097 family beta strand repeat-containing protein [Pseudalkalibacillus caeni]|uniref:DUF4097 domain-containing protein n=1 Tax=Exobacillus caeni TaxID=2574798 RepID=A0A5R9FAR1_9BACL|nr:DUF4097 family beta strand repeat-containing protein [Pseudalkalibacillus caeni]TLS37963.1 DUF4097 domain-containing protein [Pseudalkalibacillus caeni]
MKNVVIVVLGVLVLGVIGVFLTGNSLFAINASSVDEEKSFSGGQFSTVEVYLDAGHVEVTEGDDDKIHVRLTGKDMDLTIDDSGDTLKVRAESEEVFNIKIPFITGNDDGDRHLEIALPKKEFDKIEVKNEAGKLELGKIEAKKLVVDTKAGEVTVDGFIGDYAKLSSDAGKIDIKEATGKLDIKTKAGQINTEIEVLNKDINIETEAGEVNVDLKKIPEDLKIEAKTTIGKIDANLPDIDFDESSNGTIVKEIGEGGPVLKIRTTVGKINLNQ